MVEVQALDCLRILVQEGSFEKAAQKMALTQSAVSQRIKTLEEQMGCTLVQRTRPVRATEAGTICLRFAQSMQWSYTQMQHELNVFQEHAHKAPLPLHFAQHAWCTHAHIVQAFDSLHQHNSTLTCQMVSEPEDIIQLLLQAQVHCALTPLPTTHTQHHTLEYQCIGMLPFVWVASAQYAQQHISKGFGMFEAQSCSYIHLPEHHQWLQHAVVQQFGPTNPKALRMHQAVDCHNLVQLLIQGWGVSAVPYFWVAPYLQKGQLVNLNEQKNTFKLPLFFIYRKELEHPALSAHHVFTPIYTALSAQTELADPI